MGAISATDIISIIQSEIENFDFDTESRETGEVISCCKHGNRSGRFEWLL